MPFSADSRSLRLLAGVALAAAAVWGMVQGARAAAAQRAYFTAKYGLPSADYARIIGLCRRGYALYPHNYYGSILAAETAFRAFENRAGPDPETWRRQSRLWCERGLSQNPWRGQLRRLMTRFLWEEDPVGAAAYWETFTEWNFWEPENHALLADLYARLGVFDRADEALYWAQGSGSYDDVRKFVRAEERRQADAAAARLLQDWGE
jgi:hypothetical protein